MFQIASIHDFKVSVSINGELASLEDTRAFTVQEFISNNKFLITVLGNPSALYYYDVQTASMHTVASLDFTDVSVVNFQVPQNFMSTINFWHKWRVTHILTQNISHNLVRMRKNGQHAKLETVFLSVKGRWQGSRGNRTKHV